MVFDIRRFPVSCRPKAHTRKRSQSPDKRILEEATFRNKCVAKIHRLNGHTRRRNQSPDKRTVYKAVYALR